jgi:hypothetical protein
MDEGQESDVKKRFVETASTNQPMLMKAVKVLLQRLEVHRFGDEEDPRRKTTASESETKENSPPKVNSVIRRTRLEH